LHDRAAIVSISASDGLIDAAIRESLAIVAGDPEPPACFGDAERLRPRAREVRRPQLGHEQALGPRAGSSKQQ
jgi:hypothetical protein